MDGSGAFFFCEADGFADAAGDVVDADDLVGEFGDGFHHFHDVEDLEAALFAAFYGFLAGDHHHGHGSELGVGGGGDEVCGAGAEGGEADAGFAGEAAVGGGHEAGALFVAGEDELDGGAGEGV